MIFSVVFSLMFICWHLSVCEEGEALICIIYQFFSPLHIDKLEEDFLKPDGNKGSLVTFFIFIFY